MPDQPFRALTEAGDCLQHLLSARKIMSGSALSSASWDSCGYPPFEPSASAASATLLMPNSPKIEPMNVFEVTE